MDPFQTKFHIFWQKTEILDNKIFLKCKSPHLAILINIWHIWEDRSRKVNNYEPDLRFFHGNFWTVISQAVRKPCFSAWIPRGPNFWKPLTCGYVAAGTFFLRKKGPHISLDGTARKILARKNNGTAWPRKRYHTHFCEKIFFGYKIRFCPDPKSHF